MSHRARTWRGAAGVCVALGCSVAMLSWATDGLAVLTSDAARARQVQQTPVAVPTVLVRAASGAVHEVLYDEAAEADGAPLRRPRAVIVDFVYTRCLTVCGVLGGVYQQLQRAIVAGGLQDQVRLLTISFDLVRDDPASLALYARMQRADAAVWSVATPVDTAGRDRLLQTFGIQVVPDGTGGWVHNAALHIVDPDGRLVHIGDIDDIDGALARAQQAWGSAR